MVGRIISHCEVLEKIGDGAVEMKLPNADTHLGGDSIDRRLIERII